MLKQKLYNLILNCVPYGKLVKVIEMFSDELRFTQLLRQLKPLAAEIPCSSFKCFISLKINILEGRFIYMLVKIKLILKDFFFS